MKTLVLLLAISSSCLAQAVPKAPRLGQIVGKTVYVCAGIDLFEKKTKLVNGLETLDWGARYERFGGLWNATIEDAQIVDDDKVGMTVAIELKLKNGATVVRPIRLSHDFLADSASDLLDEVALVGGFRARLKPGLSWLSTVQKGMTRDDVICLKGVPDRENDFGASGRQLIYKDLYITIAARTDRVSEVMRLNVGGQ